MEQESNFSSSEEELQQLRELRYRGSLEREKNREIRETIDIFQTPLFFRKDSSFLSYLEYERKKGIISADRTFADIQGTAKRDPEIHRAPVIYLELPLPYYQERRNLGSILDDSSIDGKHQLNYFVEKICEQFPGLDPATVAGLVKITTRLAYAHEIGRRPSSKEEVLSQQAFLKEFVENPEYRKIWLAVQKMILDLVWDKEKGDMYTKAGRVDTTMIGIHSQFNSRRGGTFLVSPSETNLFSINPNQSHTDFIFEVLAIKGIPEKNILGYLEYTEKDAHEKLDDIIINEASKIYGYKEVNSRHQDKSGIASARYSLYEGINEIETGTAGRFGGRRATPGEVADMKKQVCAVLGIEEEFFNADEARARVESTKGVLNLYHKFFWPGIKGDARLTDFPDIPVEDMTLGEIQQEIFRRILPRLKELFPFQSFRFETVDQDIVSGVRKYIIDRFGVNPEEITKKDFVELLVKTMGIPIYNIKGDQLWPVNKTYEEIHGQAQKE